MPPRDLPDEAVSPYRARPYDLNDDEERKRLIREVTGYMKVGLHYGTDKVGREYAYHALALLDMGLLTGDYAIVKVH